MQGGPGQGRQGHHTAGVCVKVALSLWLPHPSTPASAHTHAHTPHSQAWTHAHTRTSVHTRHIRSCTHTHKRRTHDRVTAPPPMCLPACAEGDSGRPKGLHHRRGRPQLRGPHGSPRAHAPAPAAPGGWPQRPPQAPQGAGSPRAKRWPRPGPSVWRWGRGCGRGWKAGGGGWGRGRGRWCRGRRGGGGGGGGLPRWRPRHRL